MHFKKTTSLITPILLTGIFLMGGFFFFVHTPLTHAQGDPSMNFDVPDSAVKVNNTGPQITTNDFNNPWGYNPNTGKYADGTTAALDKTSPPGQAAASVGSPQSQAAAKATIVPNESCGIADKGTSFSMLSCFGQIVHLIWFSPMAWLMGVAGFFLNMVMQEFIVSFGAQTTILAAVTNGWMIMRDLANMVIIFFLLATGIGTILRLQDWGWKLLLSRVIIAAIVINFSLFITKIIIDTSNLFTSQIYASILTKAYGGSRGSGSLGANGASSTYGQLCTQTRADRASILAAGNTGTTTAARNSDAQSLLSDPCLRDGISGAFANVLRMTTLMTVPQGLGALKGGTGGTSGKPAEYEFPVNSKAFLMVGALGGFMFFVCALLFGAMAIMLFIRWGVLITLMIFSPIWLIGMIFGKGGKEQFDRLIENALFPPLFFIFVYVAYIIAKGSLESVTVNGLQTSDVASYTLLALGSGGWYLLLHFALVIMMLVLAMKFAVDVGDETAQWGGGLALGALAGSGYLAWKGAKGGGKFVSSRIALGTGNAFALSGLNNTWAGRYVAGGIAKLSAPTIKSREKEEERRVREMQRSRIARAPSDVELSELTAEEVKQRILTRSPIPGGRKKILDWLKSVAHKLSPEKIESIRKSAGLTLEEGNQLVDAHFRSGNPDKPRLFELLDTVRQAEDTRKQTPENTPAYAEAKTKLEAAEKLARTEVAKLNTTQISMLGERGLRQFTDDQRHPRTFAALAEGFTGKHIAHISDNAAFGEHLEETIKQERYQSITDVFNTMYTAKKEGDKEAETLARKRFNELYRSFGTDELGQSNFIAGLSQEQIEDFTDTLSPDEFAKIQRSTSWEKHRGKIDKARIRKFTKALETVGKTENPEEERKKIQEAIRDFGSEEWKLANDVLTSASEGQLLAFAMKAGSPKVVEKMKAAGVDNNVITKANKLREDEIIAKATKAVQTRAQEDRDAFRNIMGSITQLDLPKESRKVLGDKNFISLLKTSEIMAYAGAEQGLKDKVIETLDELDRNGTASPDAKAAMEQLTQNPLASQMFSVGKHHFQNWRKDQERLATKNQAAANPLSAMQEEVDAFSTAPATDAERKIGE